MGGKTPWLGGQVKGMSQARIAASGPSFGFESQKIRVGFSPRIKRQWRRAMAVQALGYAGFGSAALEDWRQFGTGLVGLQAVEGRSSPLAFRMDDRKQRIVIYRPVPGGARFVGREGAGARTLGG